jgi:hypothetical protein
MKGCPIWVRTRPGRLRPAREEGWFPVAVCAGLPWLAASLILLGSGDSPSPQVPKKEPPVLSIAGTTVWRSRPAVSAPRPRKHPTERPKRAGKVLKAPATRCERAYLEAYVMEGPQPRRAAERYYRALSASPPGHSCGRKASQKLRDLAARGAH